MGLSEHLIDQASEEIFSFSHSTLIGFDDFQLLYFEIFSRLQKNLVDQAEVPDLNATGPLAENGTLLNTENDEANDDSLIKEAKQPTSGKKRGLGRKRSLITATNIEMWASNTTGDYETHSPMNGSKRNRPGRVDVISEKEEFNGGDLSHSASVKDEESSPGQYEEVTPGKASRV